MSIVFNIKNHQIIWFLIILATISTLGGYLLIIATPMGLGQINDSTAYIAGARSILQGTGYSEIWLATSLEPITHYPPLLCSILALIGFLGLDPARGFRVLNILLYISTIFVMGILGHKMTKSKIGGIVLALVFIIDGTLLQIYGAAISEPLFIFLTIISFLVLTKYLEDRKIIFLIVTGIIAGLSVLTRYVGLALLASISISLFVLVPDWKMKFKSASIFLLFSLPFFIAWTVRNRLLTGMSTNRGFGWHPVSIDNIQLGLRNFSEWLGISTFFSVDGFIAGAILFSLIFISILIWVGRVGVKTLYENKHLEIANVFTFIVGTFSLVYISALLTSISLFDDTTKIQDRFLSPFYVTLIILLVSLLSWLWHKKNFLVRIFVILVFSASILTSIFSYYQTIDRLSKDGVGYASVRFKYSPVANHIKLLPVTTNIYTNSPPAVYSSTDRASYIIFLSSILNDDLRAQYAMINNEVKMGKAIIALYGFTSDVNNNEAFVFLTDGLNLQVKNGTQWLYSTP